MFEKLTTQPVRYRYRLKELFIKHFGANASAAQKEFARLYGHAYTYVSEDCNKLLHSAERPIPAERLKEYAQFFNVTESELRNLNGHKKHIYELV